MDPEVRSHEGLFLTFQYPLEIAGAQILIFCVLPIMKKINITIWRI